MATYSSRSISFATTGIAVAFLFGASQVRAQNNRTESSAGLTVDAANALSKLGTDFMVGTYTIISNNKKTSPSSVGSAEIGEAGDILIESYNQSVREGTFGANLLHDTISIGIATGAIMASSTAIGAVPAGALAVVANSANDKVRDYMLQGSIGKASAVLSKGIGGMTRNQRVELERIVKNGNLSEAAKYFDASTNVLSKMKKGVANDPIASELLDQAITESLKLGSETAIRAAGQAYEKASDLEGQFTSHIQGVTNFNKKVAASLTKLEIGVNEVRKEMDGIQSEMQNMANANASTAFQVQVIQDVLFDQQPAAVKLMLLESNAKPGLTAIQRDQLKATLSVQVKQQQLLSATTEIVGYARDLNTILGGFGVHDERLGEAVQYGNAAATAMQQAFSGNYLGAIATVSGLFGGERPDPVQEQFKKIFAELSRINEKLDRVLELQIETLKSIEMLSKQMAELQRHIDHRFDRVDFELAKLNEAAQVLVWDKISPCGGAWKVQNEPDPHQFNPAEGRFRSHKAMYSYTSIHGDKAFKCADALDNLFYNYRRQSFAGNPLSLSFVRPILENAGLPNNVVNGQYGLSALETYRDKLHAPAFRVLEHGWSQASVNSGWGSMANAFALLSTPSGTADHLLQRVAAMNESPTASACKMANSVVGKRVKTYLCSDLNDYDEQAAGGNEQMAQNRARSYLSDPLVRDQVGELTKFAMLVAGPREMAKSDSAPGAYTIDELASRQRAVSYGRPLLEGALMVADASIAQLAMIYGDLTAWFIFDMLWDREEKRFRLQPAKAEDKVVFEDAMNLLKNQNNPWLQHNVLMLILGASEIGCRSSKIVPACLNRKGLYKGAFERYFPIEIDENALSKLAVLDEIQQEAAEATMKMIFDVHKDVRFQVRDYSEIDGVKVSIPRQVLLAIDGYLLAMPSVTDWAQRKLLYPPFMNERLSDKVVIARRYADYAMYDKIDAQRKLLLTNILSNGSPPSLAIP